MTTTNLWTQTSAGSDAEPEQLTTRVVKQHRRQRITVAVGAVLITALSGCGHQPAPSSSTPDGAGTSSTATTTQELDTGTVRRLDAAIEYAMHAASVPGAIVGVWAPQGRYLRTFGVADKATGEAMSVDFFSRIGSVTKSFTVTALLQLADKGMVRLEDPIAKYVNAVPDGDHITLRQLARMESCLYNYTDNRAFERTVHADPQHQFSQADLLEFAFTEPPLCTPGTGFHYSNTNAILLGLVVEKVSGQSLPDYISEHLLLPLGLSHTSFPTTSAFPQPHAKGYTNWTADGREVDATDWNPSWSWAAGAMISTLEDLHVWTVAAATGEMLTAAMQRQRLETISEPGVTADIGYGLGIFNLAGWIGHSGTVPGYGTVAVYLPDQQLTLIILVNTDIRYRGNDPCMTLASAITKVISPEHIYDVGL